MVVAGYLDNTGSIADLFVDIPGKQGIITTIDPADAYPLSYYFTHMVSFSISCAFILFQKMGGKEKAEIAR